MVHTFCVDGTNVVRGCYGYGGPEFRQQEDADSELLVASLGVLCESLEGRIEVEVFFDGGQRALRSTARNLRVRFTHEVPADDMILDRVRSKKYSGGGGITVVTGDGDLGRMAAEEGARWQRVGPGQGVESVLHAIEKRFPC
jgi:hypothetical protein